MPEIRFKARISIHEKGETTIFGVPKEMMETIAQQQHREIQNLNSATWLQLGNICFFQESEKK